MFSWQLICFPYGQVLTIWYKLNGTNCGFFLLSWHQKIYACIKITLSTIFQGPFFIPVTLSAVPSFLLLQNVPEIFTAHLTTVPGNTANRLNKAADIHRAQNYSDEFSITLLWAPQKTQVSEGRGKVPYSWLSTGRQNATHPIYTALVLLFTSSNFPEAGRVNACKH